MVLMARRITAKGNPIQPKNPSAADSRAWKILFNSARSV
jgi:hypothetical protein